MWHGARLTKLALLIATAFVPQRAWAVSTATVTFQNGADGYMGTFDRKTSPTLSENKNGASPTISYSISGYADDISVDEQALIRFDGIFGDGAGKVPPGAFILDAQLQLTTSTGGGSQTTGPYGVAGLLAPFDATTTYTDYGSRGAWWQDNQATRPTGGYGTMSIGVSGQANVRPIMQQWSDGTLLNNGFVVQAGFVGTTDSWAINTTGHPNPTVRPKLSVTYTTDPVKVNTFQRGLHGYTGDSILWMHGWDTDPPVNTASDGMTLQETILKGPSEAFPQVDIGLFKFDDMLGTGAYQAFPDAAVVKAWLVLTSGHQDAAARSTGPSSIHAVLRPWNDDSEYTNFGPAPGLTEADDDIGPALDTQRGMIAGSEVWFDVTAYVEGVRNGATDYGLAILLGTDDAWWVHSNGSSDASARPRLMIVSEFTEPVGIPGDYNNDGTVNAADYVVWRDHFGSDFDLAGNGNETDGSNGGVDEADYAHWREHFGSPNTSGSATSVPEPSNLLACFALLATLNCFFFKQHI